MELIADTEPETLMIHKKLQENCHFKKTSPYNEWKHVENLNNCVEKVSLLSNPDKKAALKKLASGDETQ
jgi:hypothetical protein